MTMAPRAETYELILDKAKELFTRFGPMRTTVADIARGLGMSSANVYKFFPNKNAIIEAVGQRFMGELHRQLIPLTKTPKPAWDRLEDVVRAVNRHFTDIIESNFNLHGAQFFQNILEFEILKRQDKFVGEFLHRTLRHELALLLREGAEAGELKVDNADILAETFLDCLSCSIEPIMLLSMTRGAIEDRLDRQLRLLARTVR
jgi:AcrR family transcriptional regulator